MEETLATNVILYFIASCLSLTMSITLTIQWRTHKSIICLRSWSIAYILQTISTVLYNLKTLDYYHSVLSDEILTVMAVIANTLYWAGAREFRGKSVTPWLSLYITVIYLIFSACMHSFFLSPIPYETVVLVTYTIGELIMAWELLKKNRYNITAAKMTAALLIIVSSQTIIVVIFSYLSQRPITLNVHSLDITFLIIESMIVTVFFTYGCICMSNALIEHQAKDNEKSVFEYKIPHVSHTNESISKILKTPHQIVDERTAIFMIHIQGTTLNKKKTLLKQLSSFIRKTDFIASYGKHQVLGIMLDTTTEQVSMAVQRALNPLTLSTSPEMINIGIATTTHPVTIEQLIQKASLAARYAENHAMYLHSTILTKNN